MSSAVLEMLTDDNLVISDRELDSTLVDHICELISGFLPLGSESESYRIIYNLTNSKIRNLPYHL
jgi:hypothetical protein